MTVLIEQRGDPRYRDSFWSSADVGVRQRELAEHWQRIIGRIPGFSVGNILDIGPGGGAQTRFLQGLYPRSFITAVDIDAQSERAAEADGLEVISLDLAAPR